MKERNTLKIPAISYQQRQQSTKKLSYLLQFLDSLGWFVTYRSSELPRKYILSDRAEVLFKKASATFAEIQLAILKSNEVEFLLRTSDLIVWREKKNSKSYSIDQNTHLTKREGEIKQLLLYGMTLSEIAEDLGISQRTVEKHVENLYRKLGIHSYNELLFGKPKNTI